MNKTLNYSITIHGATNRSLSFKWSLLKLFYFTALQVDHIHDEKSIAALYEFTVENVANADRILKLLNYFLKLWSRY